MRLTSKDIEWKDDDVCALIDTKTNELILKYSYDRVKVDSDNYILMRDTKKTVVDAVNYYEGHLMNHTRDEAQIFYNKDTEYCIGSSGFLVCTIEEFNQCVKEMSEHTTALEFAIYSDKIKSPLDPRITNMADIKPRMKIKYVECDNLRVALEKFESQSGEFYWADYGIDRITSVRSLALAYGKLTLYRKVETEIKTEKRWLIYSDKGEFLTEHDSDSFVYHKSSQVIEITVDVEG